MTRWRRIPRWVRTRSGYAALAAAALLTVLALPTEASAQQPKLDIKALVGFNATIFTSLRESGKDVERFPGFQGGFGARLSRREAFAEALITFNRWLTTVDLSPDSKASVWVNSLEIPLNLGYIPFHSAKFKFFLYGGYVNHFNIAVRTRGDIKERLRVKDTPFVVYQALFRFGVSCDLYMFNFDFNYSIGLNNATRTTFRTNYQLIQINLAYLF